MFTSPLANGTTNYSDVLFEADLRGSRRPTRSSTHRSATGRPGRTASTRRGAEFYPFYSTRMDNGTCTWQEGGRYIKGTINDFGGSSTTAFGPLLLTPYQAGNGIVYRYNNFQRDLGGNRARRREDSSSVIGAWPRLDLDRGRRLATRAASVHASHPPPPRMVLSRCGCLPRRC